MDYLLDTGVLVHAARKSAAFQAIDRLLGLTSGSFRPIVSVVTVGEVGAFALERNWGKQKLGALDDFVRDLTVVPIDAGSLVEHYWRLSYVNKVKGLNEGQNDLWIAATAQDLGATLLTFDGDFSRLPPPLKSQRFDQADGSLLLQRS